MYTLNYDKFWLITEVKLFELSQHNIRDILYTDGSSFNTYALINFLRPQKFSTELSYVLALLSCKSLSYKKACVEFYLLVFF